MFFKRAKKSDEAPAAEAAEVVAVAPVDKPAATKTHAPLDADKLRRATAPAKLGFKTTADVAGAGAEPFESRRVWDTLRATFMNSDPATRGHVLITVPQGCIASGAVKANLAGLSHAIDSSAPDWIVMRTSAEAPWTPVAVPAGQGQRLAAGISAVMTGLRGTLPFLLGGEDLKHRRIAIEAGFAAVRDDAFARLNANAHAQNVAIVTTPMGFAVAPMHEGKVVKPEVLARLPQAMRDDVRRKVESVEAELQTLLADVPFEAGSQIAEVNELVSDYVRPAITAGFEGLAKEFSGEAAIMSAFAGIEQDILTRARRDGAALVLPEYHGRTIESAGKSLVTISSPLTADALAAALLRAGKGTVLLEADSLDGVSSAWSVLKSALQSRTVALDGVTDPVAIAASVVLLASKDRADRLDRDEPNLSSQLATRTAFATDAARSEDSESALARMLAAVVASRGLLPLEASAVALLVAESARATGRPDRVSGDLTLPMAIASEASRIATLASRTAINEADILSALAEQRSSARVQALFAPPAASTAGRVLAIGLGAEPVEIWATVRPGNGTVADIARATGQADAASPATAMLWGYVAGRYIPAGSLSFSAAIVHEPPVAVSAAVRASAAELFALLSALADAPVATSYAVAGWVSPSGTLLPIPNVNEAIESAFDYAGGRDAAQPLNIVIPRGNEAGLMLRADLVDAARKGKLQIFTASDVDEGLAIITGMKAGSRADAEGESTLNRRIEERLVSFARSRTVAPDPAPSAASRSTAKAASA